MFDFLESAVKAVAGVVALPVAVAADVVTLGGVNTDQDEPYTAQVAGAIWGNVKKTIE